MKKSIALVLVSVMLLLSLVACQGESQYGSSDGDASGNAGSSPTTNTAGITVLSREDGSGTRGAFVELFGVQDEEKVDHTLDSAEVTNSTSVTMTSVAGDPNAIGYISLGSLNDTVKALRIDGVDASAASVSNGSYTICRPFNIATMGAVDALAQDFIDFILSADGQDVVEAHGYIRVADTGAFHGTAPSGKIVVGGSSSVNPVMEKLIEAYQAINTGAEIELQQSDSSTGMSNTIDGVCDIGMASRELKDSEREKGLSETVIATDGIAVIVNSSNALDGLSKEQVRQIFTGEITKWSEIG